MSIRDGQSRDRVMRGSWWILLVVYALVVGAVLAPVLFASVGADDSYWILEKGPQFHGSVWDAWWEPLKHPFTFDAQPRTAVLSLSDRMVVAVVTMKLVTVFSIPPLIVWACIKAGLVVMSVVAAIAFLRQVTFRDRHGIVRGLDRSSIAFIALALPLTIAIGCKAQNLGTDNGWNFYPTLTYGAFVGYLLFAALVLRLSSLLDHSYRRWAIPVAALMVFAGIAINLSYEVLALLIPLSVLVLLLQPLPAAADRWLRWRAKATVMLALVIPYTAMFAFIRWKVSHAACLATDSCYSGSVVNISPRAIWYNFLGATPGHNGALVTHQSRVAHLPFPDASPASIAIGVLGVVVLGALWASWNARQRLLAQPAATAEGPTGGDARGLLIVLAVALAMAVGSSLITGVTQRAVDDLVTPMVSYRTGVVTWSALALAGLVLVRLMATTEWRAVQVGGVLALAAVLIGATAIYLPRNLLTAQQNRVEVRTAFNDGLHRELALGDTSQAGDDRRCAAIRTELTRRAGVPAPTLTRTLVAADKAFEFYHHAPYCSAGIDLNPPAG
ncbi:MAG: hypothetical protein QOJ72_1751 [Nocardioidaceae bacterium]|nr:hypothetical protein [Nocardioidaceae bacterium]